MKQTRCRKRLTTKKAAQRTIAILKILKIKKLKRIINTLQKRNYIKKKKFAKYSKVDV